MFSLKLTRFIRTPVNADNGHFSVSRVTNSHILSTLFTDTGYLHTVYFLYHNYVIIVACVAWRFWLSELSNKGGRGQRNREEITPLLRPARQNRHATQAMIIVDIVPCLNND